MGFLPYGRVSRRWERVQGGLVTDMASFRSVRSFGKGRPGGQGKTTQDNGSNCVGSALADTVSI